MDIRKFFSPSTSRAKEPKQAEKKPTADTDGKYRCNGLSDERKLTLSPAGKKTKPFKPAAKAGRIAALSGDDDSDGECPISKNIRSAVAKTNRIMSDDDDEDFCSASQTGKKPSPAKKPLSTLRRGSFRDEDSSRDSAHNGENMPVERRTARKIIDESVNDVYTNKKRKNKQQPDEPVKKPRHELKEDFTDVVNDLFTGNAQKGKTGKSAKLAVTQRQPKCTGSPMKVESPKKVESLKKVESPKKVESLKKSPKKAEVKRSMDDEMWVEKYKPTQLRQLVGQHTEKSPMNKLLEWLREWPKNNLGEGALRKKTKPSPFMAQTDGSAFKAALLSGPPGIGKTTCAVMACKELGLRYVETNASDTRNKKTIDTQVAGVLENLQINNFFSSAAHSKVSGIDHVLIMDEVDGMSGNQDRAGIAELILMIKRTKVPIICICNDRQSAKIRSLANYCFDLRFSRPRAEQIKGRLLTIVAQEHLSVEKETLDKIIEASNQDIRQCINTLQMIATKSGMKLEKKDVATNNFDAARRILSRDSNLFEKQELFFSDYSIMPLFVHENYLNVRAPKSGNAQHLHSIRQAADCLAFGDIIEKQVRSNGAWNLLVDQAMFSCALPAVMMDGYLNAQLQFPSWFGKTSNEGKRRRFMRQLASHTHRKISGSTSALVTDYLPVMRERLYRPLIQNEATGVREVVEFYKAYDLVRDDTEAINDLGIWPNANKSHKDISQLVSTKAKSALTRALNKEHRLLPFAQGAPVKGRAKGGAAAAADTSDVEEENTEEIEDEVNDVY